MSKLEPISPGEILLEEFLVPMGISQTRLAGDIDVPVSRVADIVNGRRLSKPQVRRPGSDHWEDIGWEQAIDEIGRAVKTPRARARFHADQVTNGQRSGKSAPTIPGTGSDVP